MLCDLSKTLIPLVSLWMAVSCAEMDPNDVGAKDEDSGNPVSRDGGDWDFDGDGVPDVNAADVCGDFRGDPQVLKTRMMIVEDGSLSMSDEGKWETAVSAIGNLVSQFNDVIELGIDVFPAVGEGTPGGGGSCTVNGQVMVDAAPGNAGTIMDTLNGVLQLGGSTPLLMALANFSDPSYSPSFSDVMSGSPILVVVSDGEDTCGLNVGFPADPAYGASTAELETVTRGLHEDLGLRIYVIGFGGGIQGAGEAQLNAIARAGGTGQQAYLDATNPDNLSAVLSDLAHAITRSCRYRLGALDDPSADLERVNVYLDGQAVARDAACVSGEGDGWWWVDEQARDTVQFCGASCEALQRGEVEKVTVLVMCRLADVV